MNTDEVPNFRVRGQILRLLASFHRSPANDGTLYMEVEAIANTLGLDVATVRRVCGPIVGDILVSKDALYPETAYRLSSTWLLRMALEQQNREVAELALGDR